MHCSLELNGIESKYDLMKSYKGDCFMNTQENASYNPITEGVIWKQLLLFFFPIDSLFYLPRSFRSGVRTSSFSYRFIPKRHMDRP